MPRHGGRAGAGARAAAAAHLPAHFPATVQRGHGGGRPAPEPRRHARPVDADRTRGGARAGRGAGGHARGAPLGPRRARRACRGRACDRARGGPGAIGARASTRCTPTCAPSRAAAAGRQHRPADLAPARPPALRRARADRDPHRRRRPRHAARPGRGAARAARRDPGARGPGDREAGARAADPRARRPCSGGAPRRLALAGAEELQSLVEGVRVTQVVEGSRRFDLVREASGAGTWPAGAGRRPGRDAARPRAAVQHRGDRGRRRPEPDLARRRSPARIVISANAQGRALATSLPTSVRSSTRRQPARGLFRDARRPVPGPGGGQPADRRAGRRVGRSCVPGAVFAIPVRHAGAAGHGQRAAGARRQRHRAVDLGPAAVGRGAGGLRHARWHRHAQRHPEGRPLGESDALRGGGVRPGDDPARFDGAAGPGADDGADRGARARAAAVRGRAARHRDPASGGGRHLLGPDQLDAARHLRDAGDVRALRPQRRRTPARRQVRRGFLNPLSTHPNPKGLS